MLRISLRFVGFEDPVPILQSIPRGWRWRWDVHVLYLTELQVKLVAIVSSWSILQYTSPRLAIFCVTVDLDQWPLRDVRQTIAFDVCQVCCFVSCAIDSTETFRYRKLYCNKMFLLEHRHTNLESRLPRSCFLLTHNVKLRQGSKSYSVTLWFLSHPHTVPDSSSVYCLSSSVCNTR